MGTLTNISLRYVSLMPILPIEARAMYRGGRKISASDDILSRLSSCELGLRCTVCGEPVCYNNGEIRDTYFSHYPKRTYLEQEECERRRTYVGEPRPAPKWYSIDQKQKLELFQKYFFEIVRTKLIDLPPYCTNDFSLHDHSQNIDPIYTNLLLSIRKRREYCEQYIQRCENHYIGLLQIDIAREAFDYLMVASSEWMVLAILQNLVSNNRKVFASSNIVCATEEIMVILADTLITIRWPELFEEYQSTSHSRKNSSNELSEISASHRIRVDALFDSFVCLREGKLTVETILEDSIERVVLGYFDTRELRRREMERRKPKKSIVPRVFSVQVDILNGPDEMKREIEQYIRRAILELDADAKEAKVDRTIISSSERKEVTYEESKSYKRLVCFKKKVLLLRKELRINVSIEKLLACRKGEVILHQKITDQSADHLMDYIPSYPSRLWQSYYHRYEDSRYSQRVVAKVSVRIEEGKNCIRKTIAKEFFTQSAEYETVIVGNPEVKDALSRLVKEVCEKLIKSVDLELRLE